MSNTIYFEGAPKGFCPPKKKLHLLPKSLLEAAEVNITLKKRETKYMNIGYKSQ